MKGPDVCSWHEDINLQLMSIEMARKAVHTNACVSKYHIHHQPTCVANRFLRARSRKFGFGRVDWNTLNYRPKPQPRCRSRYVLISPLQCKPCTITTHIP